MSGTVVRLSTDSIAYSILPVILLPPPARRLVLRLWRDDDFPAFAAMNADSRVMKYFPAPLSEAESLALFYRIRTEFADEGFGLYAVERSADGALLGFTGLHRINFDTEGLLGKIEIGWRLRAEAWTAAMPPKQHALVSRMQRRAACGRSSLSPPRQTSARNG